MALEIMTAEQYRARFKSHFGRDPGPVFCQCCDRKLTGRLVELELNSHTGKWAIPGEIPEYQSQGCFTLGLACARRALKE